MSECIEFQGYRNKDGYGQVNRRGVVVGAHRLAYCNANGLSLDDIRGKVIRHKCDNPPCINPDHLEIGTQSDNVKDCVERGRFKSNAGELNPRAKLNRETAESIRAERLSGLSLGKLAIKYGVGKSTIKRVVDGDCW